LVELRKAGADVDVPIEIKSSRDGVLRRGGVEIKVEAGKRVLLDIELAQSFTGALKVMAYEIR
jgi:hypothetical protein